MAARVNAIDTKIPSINELVTITQYDSNKQGLEKNIDFDKKKKYPTLADYSRRLITTQKITEIENKTTSVTGLVTSAAFNTKVTEIEIKYLMLLICLTKLL